MAAMSPALHIDLPEWLTQACAACGPLATEAERMAFVVDLSRHNVETRSGGPFAAAVFEIASGRLVAAATNLVVASHCSAAHAEVLALSFAQQALGRHDLGANDLPAMELVGSCEPCAMCLGALGWSGVRRVVCAATGADAEVIGFDEGPKPANWAGELRRRGIEVVEGVLRAEAVAVLLTYRQLGGLIYNGRAGSV